MRVVLLSPGGPVVTETPVCPAGSSGLSNSPPLSTGAAFIDSALRASHFASETILFKVTHLLAPPCCVGERRPRFVQGGGPGLT